MVELRLSATHRPLQTSGTTATIAGAGFVAIEHGHGQAVQIRKSLVSFQAIINVMNALPQGWASRLATMRPKLSELQSGPPNQAFQNFAERVISRAFRL